MIRKTLVKVLVVLAIVVTYTAIYAYIDYEKFKITPVNLSRVETLVIEPGSNFKTVNTMLSERDIITESVYLKVLARQTGQARQIKSGEYRLQPGLTPTSLLSLLVSGKVTQYTLTLVEGWHVREILAAVQNDPVLEKTLDYAKPETLMNQLGYPDKNPEGMFFPDTYHFPRGTTDKKFLLRAYERLQLVLQEEWEQREEGLPYETPYEALIMASIIEKETGLASEREKIAGVFVRRLQKGMKLQTDPTVIYAMGQQFDGNIRKKDLSIDSPHNTYRYAGLPPTPIALAGREAIYAALHPEPGKSLYFVAKGDGSHYFSETLTEHNKAVAKYQLNR